MLLRVDAAPGTLPLGFTYSSPCRHEHRGPALCSGPSLPPLGAIPGQRREYPSVNSKERCTACENMDTWSSLPPATATSWPMAGHSHSPLLPSPKVYSRIDIAPTSVLHTFFHQNPRGRRHALDLRVIPDYMKTEPRLMRSTTPDPAQPKSQFHSLWSRQATLIRSHPSHDRVVKQCSRALLATTPSPPPPRTIHSPTATPAPHCSTFWRPSSTMPVTLR